ncbi:TPA: ATP-binding protein, partial [Acinetobacter baumannii]
LIDSKIKKPSSTTKKTAFADGNGVGTIKYKLDFCREIIKDFDENPDWQLTPKAKALCERIFKHIEKCNQ